MPNIAPIRIAVAGVSGYAGAELARLLLTHPRLAATPPIFLGRPTDTTVISTEAKRSGEIPALAPAPAQGNLKLTDLHPQLSGLPNADAAMISPFDWQQLKQEGIELLFTATPHEQAHEWAPIALAHGIKVIDMSAAWRLQHAPNRAIYKLDATAETDKLQLEAVYGSPELHGAKIKTARLVANPGCYATSIILALAPLLRANLVDLTFGIIADAKSGVSGAGKTPVREHALHVRRG